MSIERVSEKDKSSRNAKAQKAHRERKAAHVKALEDSVALLREQVAHFERQSLSPPSLDEDPSVRLRDKEIVDLRDDNTRLLRAINVLQAENRVLKAPRPGPSPSLPSPGASPASFFDLPPLIPNFTTDTFSASDFQSRSTSARDPSKLAASPGFELHQLTRRRFSRIASRALLLQFKIPPSRRGALFSGLVVDGRPSAVSRGVERFRLLPRLGKSLSFLDLISETPSSPPNQHELDPSLIWSLFTLSQPFPIPVPSAATGGVPPTFHFTFQFPGFPPQPNLDLRIPYNPSSPAMNLTASHTWFNGQPPSPAVVGVAQNGQGGDGRWTQIDF